MNWLFPLLMTMAGWAGDVVENGKAPQGAPRRLVFEEELRIVSDEKVDHLAWKGAYTSVDVDKQGNIYITDPMGERVVRFDREGKHLGQIGGIGSFYNLQGFQIMADQSAVAFENVQGPSAFVFFDDQYELPRRKRNIDSSLLLQRALLSPDGKLVFGLFFSINKELQRELETGLLDRELKSKLVLSQKGIRPNERHLPPKEFWAKAISRFLDASLAGVGVVAFGEGGEVYSARTDRYEITRYDHDLNKQLVFNRAYDPIPWTRAELVANRVIVRDLALAIISPPQRRFVLPEVVANSFAEATFPSHKGPIFELIPMDEHLLVIHDFRATDKKALADIFDKQGHLVGKAELENIIFTQHWANARRLIFRYGAAYAIEETERGLELARYKYRLTEP